MIDAKKLRASVAQAAACSDVTVPVTFESGYHRVRAVDCLLGAMIETIVPDEAARGALSESIEKFLALACATAQVFVIEEIEEAQAIQAAAQKPLGPMNVH